jgi:hypothetical protein
MAPRKLIRSDERRRLGVIETTKSSGQRCMIREMKEARSIRVAVVTVRREPRGAA